MWPFSRKKTPTDRHDGYEPPPSTPPVVDPWAAPGIVAQMERRVADRADERERLDGWKNELTGVGDFMRDKSLGGRRGGLEFEVNLVTNVAAEARWRGSDLGARVVETIPDEMTREGWDVEVQPSDGDDDEGDDAVKDAFGAPATTAAPPAAPVPKPLDIDDEGIEIAEELDGILEVLGADQTIWQALCYQRAYGGGAVLVGADDGMQDMAAPLDEKRIKNVGWLNALSGGWDGEVVAWSYYNDPTKPNYGMPETYMVRNLGVPLARIPAPGEPMIQPVLPPNGATVWWVHESRLLLFSGTVVSHRARVQVRGWGDSTYTRVDEVLQQYGQTWGGIANLMTDFSQAILSIKGLAQSIAGNKGVVSSRALQMNISRSIARILLIDSEEVFKRDTVSLAGVADVLDRFALRLAAAADMPVSLLMGQVQGGLGDAAAGDIRFFYDRVASWQRRRMLPQLRRLIKLIFLSKEGPTSGVEPARWSIKARPLYQLSATERATQYLTTAQGDQIYLAAGVFSAEEAAAKRFGGSEYDPGPVALDLDGRAAMSESFSETDPTATDPNAPATSSTAPTEAKIVITPSMQGGIVKVNEARAKMGLPNWEGPDGELSINEFMAKHSGAAAQAANAEKGVVGEPQSVEEQAAAKAEQAKAAFGHKPGAPAPGEKPPFGKPEGAPAKAPPVDEPAVAPATAKKGDEFDPDQPREEDGKWGAGGAATAPASSGGGTGGSGGGSAKDVASGGEKEFSAQIAQRSAAAKESINQQHAQAAKAIDDHASQLKKELPPRIEEKDEKTGEWHDAGKTSDTVDEWADNAKDELGSAKSDAVRGLRASNEKADLKDEIGDHLREHGAEVKEGDRAEGDHGDLRENVESSVKSAVSKWEDRVNGEGGVVESHGKATKAAVEDFKNAPKRFLGANAGLARFAD